ncbi:hypothetical protein PIROE2DRAFT_2870 [Piromyces sp. E2]|nr:hypothetical protein PIROE2DRAFT_2870 [Piromyces sp. E2]|eukprot:OUM69176.1 hypothetical protein PIROE2DRAFT_2870 [Piromyces sp. E2]
MESMNDSSGLPYNFNNSKEKYKYLNQKNENKNTRDVPFTKVLIVYTIYRDNNYINKY